MADFIHSVMSTTQTIAADGVEVIDLPVNPLSVLLINIKPLNVTSTLADYSSMTALIGAITNLRVDWRGQSIIDASGLDLAAYAYLAQGIEIYGSNMAETNDFRRSVVLPIVFGNRAYNPEECIPSTKRGELELSIDWDIAATGFDAITRSIETIELPDANPTFYQRLTTLTQVFAATGDNDIDLPIGPVLRGILGFGTTAFAGATPVPTLGRMRFLIDNIEQMYMSTDFETVRAVVGLMGRHPSAILDHFHGVAADGAGEEDTRSQQFLSTLYENYAYLDMNPTGDDLYSQPTAGAGRVFLRVTAESANAARIMPISKMVNAEFFK